MKKNLSVVLAWGVSLLVVSGPAFAHHAGSTYDSEHQVTVTGTVTEFLFVNPHAQVRFEVKDDKGEVTQWTAESAPPQRLYRAGWTRNSLKPGDLITVTGAPAKDGRKFMSVRKLVAPSGQVLGQGAE